MGVRELALVIGLVTSLSGCDKLLKRKPASSGIAECDLYIAEYECFLKKTAGAAQAAEAVGPLADGYAKASATPAGATAVAQSCGAQRATMAAQFQAQGCVLGPAATPIVPATPAETAPSASAPVAKAAPAPVVVTPRGRPGPSSEPTPTPPTPTPTPPASTAKKSLSPIEQIKENEKICAGKNPNDKCTTVDGRAGACRSIAVAEGVRLTCL